MEADCGDCALSRNMSGSIFRFWVFFWSKTTTTCIVNYNTSCGLALLHAKKCCKNQFLRYMKCFHLCHLMMIRWCDDMMIWGYDDAPFYHFCFAWLYMAICLYTAIWLYKAVWPYIAMFLYMDDLPFPWYVVSLTWTSDFWYEPFAAIIYCTSSIERTLMASGCWQWHGFAPMYRNYLLHKQHWDELDGERVSTMAWVVWHERELCIGYPILIIQWVSHHALHLVLSVFSFLRFSFGAWMQWFIIYYISS